MTTANLYTPTPKASHRHEAPFVTLKIMFVAPKAEQPRIVAIIVVVWMIMMIIMTMFASILMTRVTSF